MTKGYTIKNAELKHRIHALCVLAFKGVSEAEEDVLCSLAAMSVNNSLSIEIELSKQIQQELNISQSYFATSISRLGKKGILAKQGKVVTLNPAFANIQKLQRLVIDFE